MSIRRHYFLTLAVLAGSWAGAVSHLQAQSGNTQAAQIIPSDIVHFRELLDADPADIPVLVLHKQDPNPLRPNESLAAPRGAPTAGEQRALSILGQPRSGQMYAGRSRLRSVAMSQNRAAPMIGDLFGGGSSSLILTRDVMDVIPFASPPPGGNEFNGFVGFRPAGAVVNPVGPFFGGTPGPMGFPLLTTIGTDTDGDNLQDTFSGLQQYGFNSTTGVADPTKVLDQGPFDAVLNKGRTVEVPNSNGTTDTVFVLGLQQTLRFDNIPSPSQGGAVGRVKIAENASPMPRDRAFFNYSYFDNVPLIKNGININRFTPGFEKTIQDGTASIEVRTPFATTMGSNVSTSGITDGEQLEFGNVSITYKSLVYRDDDLAISGGLQVGLPTGDPVNVNLADGTTIVRLKNQAVNLMPFVGALYTPNERFFSQAFLQFDVAANGNDVLTNLDRTKLRQAGTIQDTTFLFLDWSAGYWSYLSDDPDAFLTGVAPTFELHMNQSLQGSDFLRVPGNLQLGTSDRNVSVLNAVIGTTFQFGTSSSMTMAYSAPLSGGADRQFDGEFRLFFNRRFGPQTIQTRAF